MHESNANSAIICPFPTELQSCAIHPFAFHRPITIMDVFAETSKDLTHFPEALSQAIFQVIVSQHASLVPCVGGMGVR